MTTYIGLIRACGDSFTVEFPDFPDLCMADHSLVWVRLGAHEMLKRRLAELYRRQEEPPAPMCVERIMRQQRNRSAVPLILHVPPRSLRVRQIS
jgi:hypothetical protein